MKFKYQARTKTGELRLGIIESSTKENALKLLQSVELYVISLEEIKPSFWERIFIRKKTSEREIIFFTRSLSTLVNSGVPLLEALDSIAVQTRDNSLRNKIQEMADSLEGGVSFSQALSRYPEIFSSFYINQIKSGEISGRLGESLKNLANFLERDYNFKGKLKGAMIYPVIIIVFALLVFVFMMIVVFPKLRLIFAEQETPMPLMTRIIFAIADHFLYILIPVVFSLIALFYFLKRPEVKEYFQKSFFKIPIISSFFREIYLSRFSQTLFSLLAAGLHLVEALEESADLVGNEIYKKEILEIRDEVKKGLPFSFTLASRPKFFSALFVQLIQAGEKSGNLVETLKKFSEFSQTEIERKLADFLKFFEPLLIILVSLFVGIFEASLILPFYQTIARF
jgi:type IV pilus assembly protein PilC